MKEYPLTKKNRIRLAGAFRDVPRVDLSIECVLEDQMGSAFVDDPDNPNAFRIQVGPFLYFAGNPEAPGGTELIQNLPSYVLIMPSSPGWFEAANDIYANRLILIDRYSFSSKKLSLDHLQQILKNNPFQGRIQKMDDVFARSIWGKEHFVDIGCFDSAEDFTQRGIGYYVDNQGEIAGAAFSSLVCSRGIEVSIYIQEEHRRKGMATVLAAQLLIWCLENHLDPHWDAANPESCHLAMKLGYLHTGSYEAFVLGN